MKTIECKLDYTERKKVMPWGEGPWNEEPDKRQWVDEATGLPCLIVRNHMGSWCGYVGVPYSHPWFEKHYDEVEPSPEVHWGLTYSNHCCHQICHVVDKGEDDNVWWLGFDCSHFGDITPSISEFERKHFPNREMPEMCQYRDIHFVTAEVTGLAKQASEAKWTVWEWVKAFILAPIMPTLEQLAEMRQRQYEELMNDIRTKWKPSVLGWPETDEEEDDEEE